MLERGQGLIPEVIEVLAKGFERVGIEGVDAARAVGAIGHEPSVLEDAEMLRDRGTADGELARELPDGQRTLQQARQDRPARAVTQGVELRMFVSNHLR